MSEQKVAHFERFELESGQVLNAVEVAYRTWGQLNDRRDNAFVVFHSLTGDADITGWWGPLIGPGRAVDTNRYFVICANLLGSCYGTTGPSTHNPDLGRSWQADFPVPTVRDNVRLQQQLVRQLGVKRVDSVLGGSLGGMLALEWAAMDPDLGHVIAVSTSGRHSAWCIAWSESQRQAIYSDPNFNGGYYSAASPPSGGLAAARMMALLSYRTPDSFTARFGRETVKDEGAEAQFTVQSFLDYQGEKLVRRFDANSYVRLSQTANTHDLSRNRGKYEDVLAGIEQPALIVGINTDILFPLSEQRELADGLPNATLEVIHSSHGHDAFLIEGDRLNTIIWRWLHGKTPAQRTSSSASLNPCVSI